MSAWLADTATENTRAAALHAAGRAAARELVAEYEKRSTACGIPSAGPRVPDGAGLLDDEPELAAG